MRLDQALLEATRKLLTAEVEGARQDAGILMTFVLKADRDILYREPERLLSGTEYETFCQLVARRCDREPISHLLGTREFWSRNFIVNEHVLDPRPDTETLVSVALEAANDFGVPRSILDLGTGSGCLIVTLLAELSDAQGTAVDLSPDALDVARQNAELNGVATRCNFVEGAWFDKISGQFDLIVSNPPYIPLADATSLQPEVREYEPHLALFGGEDGLDCYREIISAAPKHLRKGGWLGFEVGIHQAEDVRALMEKAGFDRLVITNDLASIGRCVSGRL